MKVDSIYFCLFHCLFLVDHGTHPEEKTTERKVLQGQA